MARPHAGLPPAFSATLSKQELLTQLQLIDSSDCRRNRVLRLENAFRRKIDSHIVSLPAEDSLFQKFNTSPYVLLMHAKQKNYTKIRELEADILPAKQFSSMETSAGKMIEEVVLPEYGWQCVASEMHTSNSALDGKRSNGNVFQLVTLKSGPKCLNDEMSENFADAILSNAQTWAREADVQELDFTYGVLYGTKRQSNKKDWHILRNLKEKRPQGIIVDPANRWDCKISCDGIQVLVSIKIGLDWWKYLGGPYCFIEVFTALIRSCINVGRSDTENYHHTISDLNAIVSTSNVHEDYNVSLLQRNQIPWLFLTARHFCDNLIE